MVDAIVLAGADNDGRLAACDGAHHEALIDIAGKPMICYVLEALKACGGVGRVAVVGPRDALEGAIPSVDTVFVERRGSILGNLWAGIEALRPEGMVLIVTADVPFLTAEAVEDLLQAAERDPADVYYPILSREINEAKFPGMKRTYLTVAEGTFTGGNVVLARPAALDACGRLLEQAVATRKKPWMMAGVLGPWLTVKFIFRRLSVHDVERRFQAMVGVRAIAVVSKHAEIAFDVDKPSDLELARKLMLTAKPA